MREKKVMELLKNALKNAQRKKWFIPLLLATFIAAAVLLFVVSPLGATHTSPTVISKATLEKIINVSDLSTFEAVYNGIAAVPGNESEDAISYYVSYNGRVKAGINIEDIAIDVDNEEKVITVNLPEVKITDISVDITSLDYLFVDDKANTYFVSEEAYRKCIEDVTNRSSQATALYELAEENAKSFIHALLSPFVAFFDSQYQIQIY